MTTFLLVTVVDLDRLHHELDRLSFCEIWWLWWHAFNYETGQGCRLDLEKLTAKRMYNVVTDHILIYSYKSHHLSGILSVIRNGLSACSWHKGDINNIDKKTPFFPIFFYFQAHQLLKCSLRARPVDHLTSTRSHIFLCQFGNRRDNSDYLDQQWK